MFWEAEAEWQDWKPKYEEYEIIYTVIQSTIRHAVYISSEYFHM